jgi:hypothetical protein
LLRDRVVPGRGVPPPLSSAAERDGVRDLVTFVAGPDEVTIVLFRGTELALAVG